MISPLATQLLSDVHSLGVELQARGDVLRFRPRQSITADLLRRLQAHKVELLAMALIHQARARGDQDLAEAMEEAWGERIAISVEDGKESEQTAEAIALEQLRMMTRPLSEVSQATSRKLWNPTPADEAVICRAIEKDQGLPAGSVRLYSPQELRKKFGDKRL